MGREEGTEGEMLEGMGRAGAIQGKGAYSGIWGDFGLEFWSGRWGEASREEDGT